MRSMNEVDMPKKKLFLNRAIEILVAGGVGVLPTDTIYGLVGSALDRKTVGRIYRLKRRDPKKSMIVLIGDMSDLSLFGITPTAKTKQLLEDLWPGKVSVVLGGDTKHATRDRENETWKHFEYLEKGAEGLAFRLPKPLWLRGLLKKTGPLVAPSANFENKPPALTIKEAKKYFGRNVDFYVDAGKLVSKPSTLIKIKGGNIKMLRRGAVNL